MTILLPDIITYHDAVELCKIAIVREAIAQAGGSKAKAARLLGISREGLHKVLKREPLP